jgi:hypothetical protein
VGGKTITDKGWVFLDFERFLSERRQNKTKPQDVTMTPAPSLRAAALRRGKPVRVRCGG